LSKEASDDYENYYTILGLSPDATMEEVKSRFREINDAYLKILELSRNKVNKGAPKPQQPNLSKESSSYPSSSSSPQETTTHTEPIAKIKEKFASGKIDKNQFEKLAKERYNYLKNKKFSDLSDSELEERLKGFDGLKLDPKYWK
jgi:curved DNA-binding protein CbpA